MGSENKNGKVPLISKIAYGFGDVGCNFSWMFVSNFLMIFYTDVFGISMAAVSALMLFSRFWDAIIPDCVEYGEWKTGLRNDGFQYAFVSLGNKIGMAIGTALLAALLGKYGYVANQVQNPAVLSIMRHSFTTIPGILWIVTAIVLFFYRLNKKRYNEIVEDLKKNRIK